MSNNLGFLAKSQKREGGGLRPMAGADFDGPPKKPNFAQQSSNMGGFPAANSFHEGPNPAAVSFIEMGPNGMPMPRPRPQPQPKKQQQQQPHFNGAAGGGGNNYDGNGPIQPFMMSENSFPSQSGQPAVQNWNRGGNNRNNARGGFQQQQQQPAPVANPAGGESVMDSLRQLRMKSAENKDLNNKARVAMQQEDSRKTQAKLDEMEGRVQLVEESAKYLSESLADVFTTINDPAFGASTNANVTTAGGFASKLDMEEIVKIVLNQQETIRELTIRVDTLSAKGPSSGSDDGAATKALLANSSKALAIAEENKRVSEETKRLMQDVDDQIKLFENVTDTKLTTFSDRLNSFHSSIAAIEKQRNKLHDELQENLNVLQGATFWMYGVAKRDLKVYKSIPKSETVTVTEDDVLCDVKEGDKLLLVNSVVETETGEWVRVRRVNEIGEYSQGYIPVSSSEAFFKGDMSLTSKDQDWIEAISHFSLV
jgi:hypothetical protein